MRQARLLHDIFARGKAYAVTPRASQTTRPGLLVYLRGRMRPAGGGALAWRPSAGCGAPASTRGAATHPPLPTAPAAVPANGQRPAWQPAASLQRLPRWRPGAPAARGSLQAPLGAASASGPTAQEQLTACALRRGGRRRAGAAAPAAKALSWWCPALQSALRRPARGPAGARCGGAGAEAWPRRLPLRRPIQGGRRRRAPPLLAPAQRCRAGAGGGAAGLAPSTCGRMAPPAPVLGQGPGSVGQGDG